MKRARNWGIVTYYKGWLHANELVCVSTIKAKDCGLFNSAVNKIFMLHSLILACSLFCAETLGVPILFVPTFNKILCTLYLVSAFNGGSYILKVRFAGGPTTDRFEWGTQVRGDSQESSPGVEASTVPAVVEVELQNVEKLFKRV